MNRDANQLRPEPTGEDAKLERLRDEFAMQGLNAVLSTTNLSELDTLEKIETFGDATAQLCYYMADAMLKRRAQS